MPRGGEQALVDAEELFDRAGQYLPAKGISLVKEAYQFVTLANCASPATLLSPIPFIQL